MGIHDYSCFLCSNEGDQCLTSWGDWFDSISDDKSEEDIDYDKKLCQWPPQSGHSEKAGCGEAYLFFFRRNPLEKFCGPYKHEKAEYDWDGWCFEEYEEYRDVLTNNDNGICSLWKNGDEWVINICPWCYQYFISDELHDPPPMLLAMIMGKFRLIPYQKFTKENFKIIENEEAEPDLSALFPLKCAELRDYIRTFCYYFKFRNTSVDFEYKSLSKRKLPKK